MARERPPQHSLDFAFGSKTSVPEATQAAWVEMYYQMLLEIAMSRFRWTGLPEGEIDERFLEHTLVHHGHALFFKDEGLGGDLALETGRFFACQGAVVGPVNMYQNPTSFQPVGPGAVFPLLDARHCVPIWNNMTRTPLASFLSLFANRMGENQQTETINLRAMRHTQIVRSSELKRLSAANVQRMIDEGHPVVYASDQLDMDALSAVKLGIDKEQVLSVGLARARSWNEAMTFLGIDNANLEKKERMVTDEVRGNDAQTRASRATALRTRQQAAREINRMFGLDVQVFWNSDVDEMASNRLFGGAEVDV